MKALLLNFNLKGVGTYRRTFYFSRELARRGCDATMITVSQTSQYRARTYYKRDWIGESETPSGPGPWVRVIEGPAVGYKWLPGWGSGPLDIWQRIREICTGNYDVVYGFEYHPNVAWPVYLTRQKEYRFFSDWCDWFAGQSNLFRGIKLAHRIDAFFEERIRLLAEKVSVTSCVLRDRALSLGIPHERIVHIPEGAATDYVQPLDSREMRLRLGLPRDRPVIGAVRNCDMVQETRVAAEVLKQVPDALFLFVGKSSPRAMALASQLGIKEHILNTGWVTDEDYPRYLACADVYFLPLQDALFDRARWPAKILDFLAAGRPVVTNPVGDVGPLFWENELGRVVGYQDEDFATAIVELLHNPKLARSLGENGRRVMVEQWDWRLRGEQIARVVGLSAERASQKGAC